MTSVFCRAGVGRVPCSRAALRTLSKPKAPGSSESLMIVMSLVWWKGRLGTFFKGPRQFKFAANVENHCSGRSGPAQECVCVCVCVCACTRVSQMP